MAVKKSDMFPVVLKKNYRPENEFSVLEVNEKTGKEEERKPIGTAESDSKIATGEFAKVPKDTKILIGVDEAKWLIGKGLAERADALPA